MGLVKISELTEASTLTGAERYPLVQNGNTRKGPAGAPTVVSTLAAAVGNQTADNLIWQTALNALPAAGGWIRAAGPDNVYRVERLNVANKDFVGIDLNGSTLKLADDDGLSTSATVDPTTDRLTSTIPTGFGATSEVRFVSTGTLPAPLASGTPYHVRDVVGNTFKVALSSTGAAINITTTGSGDLTIKWGIGQILRLTDVIKWVWRGNGGKVHGNYANAKAGSGASPLLEYRTTVATHGRQDFVVDIEDLDMTESAKGWGHVRLALYENSSSTFSKFERVIVRNFKSEAHGQRSGISVRGPSRLTIIDGATFRNDGQFGFTTIGATVVGSGGKPIGISAERAFAHYTDELIINNIEAYRDHGIGFTQSVRKRTTANCTMTEMSTNPYYDFGPNTVTVDAATDTFTSVFPPAPPLADYGHIPDEDADAAAYVWGTGSAVIFSTTGVLPTPLVAGVIYFTRDPNPGAGTFKVMAQAGGAAIDIVASTGSGTHSVQWKGYSYIAAWKDDDNPVDSQHLYTQIKVQNTAPHGSCQAYAFEETIAATSGKVRWESFDVDCGLSVDANTIGGDPEFRNGRLRKRTLNVAVPTNSQFIVPGGIIENVHIEPDVSIAPRRNLLIRGGRVASGNLVISPGASGDFKRVEFDGVLWNTNDTAIGRLEITPPPADGGTTVVITNTNHQPINATQQQRIRITTNADPNRNAALKVFFANRAPFILDTTGQAVTHAVNWTRAVEFYPAADQAAMLALTNAQQGDIALRTDLSPVGYFVLTNNTPGTLGNWLQIN